MNLPRGTPKDTGFTIICRYQMPGNYDIGEDGTADKNRFDVLKQRYKGEETWSAPGTRDHTVPLQAPPCGLERAASRFSEKSEQDKLEDQKAKQGGISVGTKKGRPLGRPF